MNQDTVSTPRQLQIIICDDDQDDQYLLKKALKSTGINCEIVSVFNGLELMELLLEKKPFENSSTGAIIFLDLNMPLLNGFGVLRQMKEHQPTDKIPVYMLSTSNLREDKNKALELGANDFFIKPTDFELFKSIVKDICQRHI
jgi:CheY-like chemotaxis protein